MSYTGSKSGSCPKTTCVVCGDDWQDRKPEKYPDLGSVSIPFILNFSLFTTKKRKRRVKLSFCDKHGKNIIDFTKWVNNSLHVWDMNSKKWVRATTRGVMG